MTNPCMRVTCNASHQKYNLTKTSDGPKVENSPEMCGLLHMVLLAGPCFVFSLAGLGSAVGCFTSTL